MTDHTEAVRRFIKRNGPSAFAVIERALGLTDAAIVDAITEVRADQPERLTFWTADGVIGLTAFASMRR